MMMNNIDGTLASLPVTTGNPKPSATPADTTSNTSSTCPRGAHKEEKEENNNHNPDHQQPNSKEEDDNAEEKQTHADHHQTSSGDHHQQQEDHHDAPQPRQRERKNWISKMLKIFEPLDFKNAKPKRVQHAYTVQPGDTIAGIALSHGVKEAEVRAMNNLWEGNVFAGQEIVLQRKLRSQSLPDLPGTSVKEFVELSASALAKAQVKEKEEEQPVMNDHDDDDRKSPRMKTSRTNALDVILEQPHNQQQQQQQQSMTGFFSSLFSSSFTTPSTISPTTSSKATKMLKPHAAPPRLKTRSYSERLPTNQEEQDDVYGLPKLLGASAADILSESRFAHRLVPKIEAFLPMRLRGYDWKLLYSLAQHGSSLHTLMRKVRGERASLVVVETCKGEIFGGFASAPWANALSYYGNGESFVFTAVPAFEVFNWKRTNSMVMYSNDESMAMGGGGGFAWFLNSDLSHGTSATSETFGNKRLTSQPDFETAHVEVWGFGML